MGVTLPPWGSVHSPRLNLHEPRNPEGNDETAASTAKASAPLGRGRAHTSLGTPGARGWGAEASWRDAAGTPVHGGAAQSRTQRWPPRALTQPLGFVRSRLGLGLDVAPRTVSVTSPVGSGTDRRHMLQSPPKTDEMAFWRFWSPEQKSSPGRTLQQGAQAGFPSPGASTASAVCVPTAAASQGPGQRRRGPQRSQSAQTPAPGAQPEGRGPTTASRTRCPTSPSSRWPHRDSLNAPGPMNPDPPRASGRRLRSSDCG